MNKTNITIKNGSRQIAAVCYKDESSEKLPAIIISHEFGLSMHSTARYAKELAGHGYHVFIYDFCGSGSPFCKSKGLDSTQMSVQTEVEDLKAVIDYVSKLNNVDEEHIILGGCSQGGLVTALTAAQLKEKIEKVFLYYPALCIPDDARRGCIIGKNIAVNNVPEKFTAMGYVKLGTKYVEDAKVLDPWNEICGYSKPVLLCHGTSDGIVNISYARKAAELYPDCKLVEIPGARHIFPIRGRKEAVAETIKFIGS